MTAHATIAAISASGSPQVTRVPLQMFGMSVLEGTLMVSFDAPWGQIPSMAQLPSSMAMKVIISDVMTSLALIVALRMPGTRPHTAPATIEAMTRIATDRPGARPFGRFSAIPMVQNAPNHIWPSPPTFQSCARNGIAAARPVAIRMLAVISVWPMLNEFPNALSMTALNAVPKSEPRSWSRIAKMISVAARAASTRRRLHTVIPRARVSERSRSSSPWRGGSAGEPAVTTTPPRRRRRPPRAR